MHAGMVRKPCPLAEICAQQAEAEVVVSIVRLVVVTIRRPAVPGVVVPSAAPFHTVRACYGRYPKSKNSLIGKIR